MEAPDHRAALADLAAVAGAVALLGAVTPTDAHLEHARLLADYTRGHERLPEWTYEPASPAGARLLTALDSVVGRLESRSADGLDALYSARADELRLEIAAGLAVGTPSFAERAVARFSRGSQGDRADALADAWVKEPRTPGHAAVLPSDDRDPASLVSRMRAEVSRRRLPFTVRTNPALSALAAISGDTLWVAEGRLVSRADVERTVTHEIEAHALPRTRARTLSIPLFAIGTAGGSDDQEGYALWIEERRGVSGAERRRELGARHGAVSLMRAGADFVSVVRSLREWGLRLEHALRIAERAFRGSHGATPGLGREHVYLEAYLRVGDRLEAEPEDEAVLSAGQVAVDAVEVLRPWARAALQG